jgi:hypothetical protein
MSAHFRDAIANDVPQLVLSLSAFVRLSIEISPPICMAPTPAPAPAPAPALEAFHDHTNISVDENLVLEGTLGR